MGDLTWDALRAQGIEMDHDVIVRPLIDNEFLLTKMYINMDSRVLLNHRSSLKNQDAIEVADKRYISAVYFHMLFLYTITQSRKYCLHRDGEGGHSQEVDVSEYLEDLFQNHYAAFLLSFEMDQLIAALED